jgi:demethylmenaquinone methyltransferase/2-methoxy-6-polyprenyl-1,4-benzoquinol methylase
MYGDLRHDKPSYVRAMFGAIAGSYDAVNSVLSLRRDGSWREFAASTAGVGPGGLVLDVATGTGELARSLARRNGGCRVVGLDFCAPMLERARAKAGASCEGGTIEPVLGDVLELPFPDETFDCATIGFGLRNVADVRGAFREMARVVKAGGAVVSLELTRPGPSLLRALHAFFMFRVAPHVGKLMSGSQEAYTYLPESICEFPSPEEIKALMEAEGLLDVRIHRLTLGIATVHAGVKAG